MRKSIIRILSVVTMIAIFSTMLVTVYAATPEFEISVVTNKDEVNPNDNFDVTVKLNNTSNVRGGDVFLAYDKDAFDVVSGSLKVAEDFQVTTNAADATDTVVPMYSLGNDTPGLVKFAFASAEVLNFAENVGLFKVSFKAKNVYGSYEFNLATNSGLFVGVEQNPTATEFSVKPATIKVTSDADAVLESLTVSGYNLNPEFSSDVTSYSIGHVKNSVSFVTVNAVANNSNATVEITGDKALVVGNNTVTVKVTAVDGTTTKTYTIDLTRDEKSQSGGGIVSNTITPGGNKPTDDSNDDDNKEPDNKPTDDKRRPSDMFKDLDGFDWALDAIDNLIELKVVNGKTETEFEPASPVTRAELAKLIVVALGVELDEQKIVSFSDVNSGDWFKDYVLAAASNGIVLGYPEGDFKPNAIITREEMALMIARSIGKENAAESINSKFADDSQISDWAKSAVIYLSDNGIVNGKGNNSFAPKDTATRAESAVIIDRVLKLITPAE